MKNMSHKQRWFTRQGNIQTPNLLNSTQYNEILGCMSPHNEQVDYIQANKKHETTLPKPTTDRIDPIQDMRGGMYVDARNKYQFFHKHKDLLVFCFAILCFIFYLWSIYNIKQRKLSKQRESRFKWYV